MIIQISFFFTFLCKNMTAAFSGSLQIINYRNPRQAAHYPYLSASCDGLLIWIIW